MLNPVNSNISHTMGAIDNLLEQPAKSAATANSGQIQHLTPDSRMPGSRGLAKSMQTHVDEAAHYPSTSKNPRYISLLALKNRDYQNAPGSRIQLTAEGLLGGTPEEARTWLEQLSAYDRTLVNSYKCGSHLVPMEEREHAKALNATYTKLYKSKGKKFKGEESSSRPTTGQLGLTESELKRREEQRQWWRSQNPDA